MKEAVARCNIWADASPVFAALLNSCLPNHSLLRVRRTHSLILTSGASRDRFVANHLLKAYAKLGDMPSARNVFDAMPRKNVMSWNIVLGGYIQNEHLETARKLFDEMPERNAATWNAMIAGVTHFGLNEEGLGLFCRMKKSGIRPDEFALASVLRGCAGLKDAWSGRQVHAYIVRSGFLYDLCVGSSLAHMYMNCGSLTEGEEIIEAIPASSVVSCNTVIAGRVQNCDAEGAVRYFHRMKVGNLVPDQITFTSVLAACSELATVGQGQQIHAQVVKMGVSSFLAVRSSLVSMYSKCGRLRESEKAFLESVDSDNVLWTAMIASYGFHGCGDRAVELFERMIEERIDPNEVTFLNLLYACSHSGLKERGEELFKLMMDTYKLEPKLEHYTCMVDLLGRSKCLKEAEDLIKSMPIRADAVIWKTLLSSCKINRNLEMAKRTAEQILMLDPHDSAPYVLLSQIHATSEKWSDVLDVRKFMKENKVKKEPGMSWVEVKNTVHQFSVGDRSHPKYKEIRDFLMELVFKIKQCGYVPDTGNVLHDMEDEEKEHNLIDHSEKLALAFALLSTPDMTPIHIMKNLRICSDCHLSIKFITKITKREIVVRDVSRFHHFCDGKCTCGDFW